MYYIGIDTAHYAKVVEAFLQKYPQAEVFLNKHKIKTSPDKWCNDQNLKALHRFSLWVDEQVVLFFHSPSEGLKAAENQLEFVKELELKKLLHFRIIRKKPSFFQRLLGKK